MVMATLTQRQAAYHICLDMGSSADGDSAVGNIICATQTKQVKKTCPFLPANSEECVTVILESSDLCKRQKICVRNKETQHIVA